MKFIKYMLGFYLLVALALLLVFWPFLVFDVRLAVIIIFTQIAFVFVSLGGVLSYYDQKRLRGE